MSAGERGGWLTMWRYLLLGLNPPPVPHYCSEVWYRRSGKNHECARAYGHDGWHRSAGGFDWPRKENL